MKILVLTPLYPPDVAEPAPYVKELAQRLRGAHDLTVLTYGRLPEHIDGVRIVAIDKRPRALLRLMRYSATLWREARRTELVYVLNGPSVELPVALVSLLLGCPMVFTIGDRAAHAYAARHGVRRALERWVRARSRAVVQRLPLPRPEILPLEEEPLEALAAYEQSWQDHMHDLEKLFTSA